MPKETIRVEQLDNGLQAAFINLPHFRTHSARLTINAGSAHETPGEHGAAHFLEHVVHQGTEEMPTRADVDEFEDSSGLIHHATTHRTFTTFRADGYDLESVGYYISQIAFQPTITSESLEGERNPIIDEERKYSSSAYYHSSIARDTVIRGEQYARPVIGTSEDIQNMTAATLRRFHQRNYKLGNSVLILCSADPVERQREFAESLPTGYNGEGHDKSEAIEFGVFNPNNLSSSLEQVDIPLSSQSSISIAYGLPEAKSPTEQLQYNLLGHILSKTAHNRLRRELALCYGAGAGVDRQNDLSFGRNRNWAHLETYANLGGEDSIKGLNVLYDDVLNHPISESVFQSILLTWHRDVDNLMQSNPSQVADRAQGRLASYRRKEFALDEVENFAANVTLGSIRKIQKDMTDTKPLIIATSPYTGVLDRIGDWAHRHETFDPLSKYL